MSLKNRLKKREYILIRKGNTYSYARMSFADDDMYVWLADVGLKEGKEIIERANYKSDFNLEVDAIHERLEPRGTKEDG